MERWKESASFCLRPFKDLHIADTGNITPCCLIHNEFFKGKISEYKESDVLLSFQKHFLTGEKHPFCNYCWELESAGVKSQRQHDVFENLRPRVHIRFSNKCNFKCRICNPTFSSSIGKENKVLKILDDMSNEEHELDNELLKELVESISVPILIDISGGEPFLSKSHFDFLKYLLKKVDTSQVELHYNTNLSTLKYNGKNLTDIWKYFGHVNVCVSIDGFGRETEYSRKGFNWDNFNRNLDTLIKWKRKASTNFISFTTVTSLYSIYGLPDLLVYIRSKSKEAEINLEWCYQPSFLNPQNLPDNEKDKIKELYTNKYDSLVYDADKKILTEVLSILYNKDPKIIDRDWERLKFISYTNKLDKHRNEKFLDVYPQFKDWINK